jgi:hypothetical protein
MGRITGAIIRNRKGQETVKDAALVIGEPLFIFRSNSLVPAVFSITYCADSHSPPMHLIPHISTSAMRILASIST